MMADDLFEIPSGVPLHLVLLNSSILVVVVVLVVIGLLGDERSLLGDALRKITTPVNAYTSHLSRVKAHYRHPSLE